MSNNYSAMLEQLLEGVSLSEAHSVRPMLTV